MGRPKGLPKSGGRQKGTPNKATAELKTAILRAFDEVGGQSYLATIAQSHPQVFCALLGKVLPMQVAGPDGGAIAVSIVERRIVRAGAED